MAKLAPAGWLILIIAGLPQLCETLYTPSLTQIAQDFMISEGAVEQTLAIYLAGFALGVLFWGNISDFIGRKPCILIGFAIFTFACLGCFYADSIYMLLIWRFVQAFGGSAGNVLAQAICRDFFHGPALSRIYSTVGAAMSIFPALGPIIGNTFVAYAGWHYIFLFIGIFTLFMMLIINFRLPETHRKSEFRQSLPILIRQLYSDRKAVICAFLVGCCNGIYFSYFAEAPFYFINLLGISRHQYSMSFILVSLASLAGGSISIHMLKRKMPVTILRLGVFIVSLAAFCMMLAVLLTNKTEAEYSTYTKDYLVITMLACHMGITLGSRLVTGNALAMALSHFKKHLGTFSSLLSFTYYCITAIINFIMAFLSNGTLVPMPLLFFVISLLMMVAGMVLHKNQTVG